MLKLLNHKAFKAMKDSMAIEPDTIRLANVGIMVFISCHFAGCLYWLVKCLSSTPAEVNDFLQSQKLKSPDRLSPGVWFCDLEDFPEGSQECERADINDVYILCFYYAMTTLTTVGYGDIGGENTAERVYCAFLQIIGTVVFATIMNQLSMVLDNINFHAQEKEHRLTKCRRFLKKHFIDEKLSRRILDWTTFQYDNDVAWHENKEIMDLLPRSMRSALALELHEKMLSTIPIFFRSGADFIAEVALRLIPERYNAGERVATCGQIIDRMYVVFNGVCVMTAPDGRHISAFTSGDYLGELNVIREQIQKTHLICTDFSELWCLEKEALDIILPRYPLIRRVMAQVTLLHCSLASDAYRERRGERLRTNEVTRGGARRRLVLTFCIIDCLRLAALRRNPRRGAI